VILPQGAAEGLSEIMRASQVPLWAQVVIFVGKWVWRT